MYKELDIPSRTIMTPGPIQAHPNVLKAMSSTTLGQFDPEFLRIQDDLGEMLRLPFGAKDSYGLAIAGSSRAGIEAALVSIVNEGDTVPYLPMEDLDIFWQK